MLLINAEGNVDLLKNHKAPQGLQYLVESMSLQIIVVAESAAARQVIVDLMDYNKEEFAEDNQARTMQSIATLAFIQSANSTAWNQPTHYNQSGINHKTKFLSLNINNVAATQYKVHVYGQLIPISRTEAIIEWFRKGR